MKTPIHTQFTSFHYLRKSLVIAAGFIALTACGGGGGGDNARSETASLFGVTESFDNQPTAMAVDNIDDTVVTAGTYIKFTITLMDILLDPSANLIGSLGDDDGQSVFVVKHDKSGAKVWDTTLALDEWNSVTDIAIDQNDGSIVLVGYTGPLPTDDIDLLALDIVDDPVLHDDELMPFGQRPQVPVGAAKLLRSWLIVKLDSEGNEVFRRTWRECLPDTYDWNENQFLCTCEAKKVVISDTGNIYISGTGGSPWPMEKVQIAGFDSNGNTLWDDLRTDIHVGPLQASNLPPVLDAIAERNILNNPESYKVINYDNTRLLHYAWDLDVTSSGGDDTIYATTPTENKELRGVVMLNQHGDITGSRRHFYPDLVTTILPTTNGRVLLGGQVDKPGTNDHAESNVTLVNSDLNTLSSYSYGVFDGFVFDLVSDDTTSVYAAANVVGVSTNNISLYKLGGLESNSLSITWDTLYNGGVDTGKRLMINSAGELTILGNSYSSDDFGSNGVNNEVSLILPEADTIGPNIILSGRGTIGRIYYVIPAIVYKYQVATNIPEPSDPIPVIDITRFQAWFDTSSGGQHESENVGGEALTAIAQRDNNDVVQATIPWRYSDDSLRKVTVRQR